MQNSPVTDQINEALNQNNTTAGKLSAVLGVIDRKVPALEIVERLAVLAQITTNIQATATPTFDSKVITDAWNALLQDVRTLGKG